MKTAFLRELGVTEQSIIDAIMAENGRDIDHVKKNNVAMETEIADLKSQLKDRDTQLNELKKSAGDNEKLTAKIAELEEQNKTAKVEYEEKLEALRRDNEIEGKLRDAKAKNLKAVKALLNSEEDLDKQIKKLVEGEETSFLFESAEQTNAVTTPKGTNPAGGTDTKPVSESKTLAEAIRGALTGTQN